MNSVDTFMMVHRMPYAFSNLPDPPPTAEPICLAGDVVMLDGPWSRHMLARVMEVSEDHAMLWVDAPVAGGYRAAVGVHRVIEVWREGGTTWKRPARTPMK